MLESGSHPLTAQSDSLILTLFSLLLCKTSPPHRLIPPLFPILFSPHSRTTNHKQLLLYSTPSIHSSILHTHPKPTIPHLSASVLLNATPPPKISPRHLPLLPRNILGLTRPPTPLAQTALARASPPHQDTGQRRLARALVVVPRWRDLHFVQLRGSTCSRGEGRGCCDYLGVAGDWMCGEVVVQ